MARFRSYQTFALVLAAASCLPGGKLPPAVATRGAKPLRPAAEVEADAGGVLRVSLASPQGDEVEAPLPTVVFTRPMRRLGDAPDSPAVEATIEPKVEGTWRWVGASALQFSPRTGFAPSTRYRVEVKPGLRSLDGQVIEAPVRLEFATPRLRVLEASDGDRDKPDEPLLLVFNQTVAEAALAKALSLRDDGGRAVPYRIEAKGQGRYELRPRGKRWPGGSALRAKIAEGLRGEGGPLTLDKAWEAKLRGREPVAVETLSCSEARGEGRCEEGSTIELSLTEPMLLSRLRPLVRVEPAVDFELLPAWDGDRAQETSYFQLKGRFRKGVPYRVVVRSSSARTAGQGGLDAGAELRFRMVPPLPWGAFLVQGTYLRPAWASKLHGAVSRAQAASFSAAALDLGAVLRRARSPSEDTQALPGQRSKEIRDAAAPAEATFVELGELLPAGAGPVLLRASWQGAEDRGESSKVLQRSELALSTRLSPEGTLVWVTRLSSGEPVAGAQVEVHDLFGRKVTATADAQGVASLDTRALGAAPAGDAEAKRLARKVVVVGRDGDDWLYHEETLPRGPRPEAALFAERGLYRPGEPVYLKGVVRLPSLRGLVPPEGRELKLTARLTGDRSASVTKRLSAFGTLDHVIELPDDLPPGRVRFVLEDGDELVASAGITVQHFRAATFEVKGSLDRIAYTQGDPFVCQGKASYFYGGSMQGTPYQFTVERRPISLTVPGLEGFAVGSQQGSKRTLLEGKSKLEAAGGFRLAGELTQPTTGPEELSCEVTVNEDSRFGWFAESTAVVHPGELYAALQGASVPGALVPGQPVSPRVLAVTPSGERRPATVELALRPKSKNTEGVEAPVASCSVTAGQAPQGCALRVPEGFGLRYRLDASVADGKGRKAVTSLWLRSVDKAPEPVRPAPARPPPAPDPPARPPLLALDQGSYDPGAVARLRVEPGRAVSAGLLTVEREGILEHRVLGASAGGVVAEFKVTEAMAPRMALRAVLLKPLAAASPYERPAEPVLQGSVDLRVKPPSRSLDVQVQPSKEEAAPGESIDVDLGVHDAAGAGVVAEVTLYAVDEGALAMTNYHVPALEEYLRSDGELLVRWAETRSELAWLLRPTRGGDFVGRGGRPPQVRMGATQVSFRDEARSDFRPTPLFLPTLVTDAEGHARASFRLPDSLTAYRIMAVAVDRGDRFGHAEHRVTASLPAQIRPTLPSVVRAGDRFEATAIVANNTARPLDLVAQIQAEGLDAASAPQPQRLEAGASRRVSFAVEARRVGAGKLTFRLSSAEGGAAADAVAMPLQIESPTALETSAIYGSTSAAVEETLADLGALRPDVGWLDVTASPSPVAGLAPGLEQLVQYPHGCVEQTVSRLVPLLSLRDLGRSLGVALPQDTDGEARKAVERLLAARDRDGRLGLWPGSRPSPWVTAYGYWGLGEARRRGLPVPAEVLTRGAALLAQSLARWPEGKHEAAEACFALDVLADLPEAEPSLREHALLVARQLTQARRELPPFARALLLHALARLDAPPGELLDELVASLHLDGPLARAVEADGFLEQLDSPVRTSALALRALLAADPKHPLLRPLALGLVADRGPSGWRTTQEAAWALLALDAYRRAEGGDAHTATGHVSLGGRELFDLHGPQERAARLPFASLLEAHGAPLRIEAHGGTLHYQARLRYAPAQPPASPRFAGFEVSKRCAPLPDPPPEGPPADDVVAAASAFAVGQWVRCQIEVITPSPRRFVAVEDPVPGGFEVVDLALRGGPPRLRVFERGSSQRRELHPDRVVYFIDQLDPGVHRWSYVARAVSAGSFVAPPTSASEMYTPETYGRTAASVVRVEP